MTTHSPIAPSAAHRWGLCPASVWLNRDEGITTSEAAEAGAHAHEVAAKFMVHPDFCTGVSIKKDALKEVCIDENEQFSVGVYLDYAKNRIIEKPCMHFVELPLDLEPVYGVKTEKGHADLVIYRPESECLFVIDFKNGYNPVDIIENKQVMIYAGAAVSDISLYGDIKTITMVIVQPHVQKEPSEWTISAEELEQKITQIRVEAQAAWRCYESDNPPSDEAYHPGATQCKYCVAGNAGKCAVQQQHLQAVMQADFTDVSSLSSAQSKIPALTDERLGEMWPALGMIESLVSGVRSEIHKRILAGAKISGVKAVTGRQGNRKYTDDTAAENLLKSFRIPSDEMYEKKIISPTKALKLLEGGSERRLAKLNALITREEGKPVIVDESDKRQALVFGALEYNNETGNIADLF
jgi:hypothetical protein